MKPVGEPGHESLLGQAIHQAGHSRGVSLDEPRYLGHCLTLTLIQGDQHVPLRNGHPVRVELPLEAEVDLVGERPQPVAPWS